MQVRFSLLVFLFLLLSLTSPAFSAGGNAPSGEGVSPRCEAAIDKAAANFSQCLLKASAKYAKKQNEAVLFAREQKCGHRFSVEVTRALNRIGEKRCTPYVREIASRSARYAESVAIEARGLSDPSFLYFQNGTGGTLEKSTLTLTGVSEKTGWFTDRPYRKAGQISTEDFLSLWSDGSNSFAADPPEADFTCEDGAGVLNLVVELSDPSLNGKDLSYSVKEVSDTVLPTEVECESDSHLFIDGWLGGGSCSGATGRGYLCGCDEDSQCTSGTCELCVPYGPASNGENPLCVHGFYYCY